MTPTLTLVILAVGALPVVACYLLWSSLRAPVPDLVRTLADLRSMSLPADPMGVSVRFDPRQVTSDSRLSFTDRLGLALMRRSPLRPSARLAGILDLRGVSPLTFYGQAVICAVTFAVLAASVAVMPFLVGFQPPWTVPVLAVVIAAGLGACTPYLLLRSQAATTIEDASEALLVFLDLVILERSADRYIRDALTSAADASDAPLFKQIRATLDRAQLERESPWPGLRRLADRMNLPALGDIADVARLQDEGGALTAALRARSAELRNAWVVRQQRLAEATTQRMEITKTLPVLIVGGIYLVPPWLRIIGS